jgi:hypothetical protein
LALIPWCKTRKMSSFPAETPNTQLSGFNIVHIEELWRTCPLG